MGKARPSLPFIVRLSFFTFRAFLVYASFTYRSGFLYLSFTFRVCSVCLSFGSRLLSGYITCTYRFACMYLSLPIMHTFCSFPYRFIFCLPFVYLAFAFRSPTAHVSFVYHLLLAKLLCFTFRLPSIHLECTYRWHFVCKLFTFVSV